MATRKGAVASALIGTVAVVVACASGGSEPDQGAFDDAGTDGTASGSGSGSGSTSGSTSGSSSGGTTSSSGSSSGGQTSDSGSGSGGGDSGSDDGGAGGDDAPGDDGGGSLCATPPDQCVASATSLGSVAGDESGSPVGASGYTSEWLRLDETEQDSSPIGQAMIFTATLTSPPGMNYDLYAYLGSSGGVGNIQCTKVTGQSTNPAGEQDQVTFQWGETTGGLANGVDDSATVMIEVRWVSGACSTAQNWSLSAHGD